MQRLDFKRIDGRAILPTRETPYSAGLDLYALESISMPPMARVKVRTGVCVAIPTGFYGRIAPRSGLALRFGIDVLAGVIDSDYRGEVACILVNFGIDEVELQAQVRIAQLIIEPVNFLEPVWSDDLPATIRGANGFGSSEE